MRTRGWVRETAEHVAGESAEMLDVRLMTLNAVPQLATSSGLNAEQARIVEVRARAFRRIIALEKARQAIAFSAIQHCD